MNNYLKGFFIQLLRNSRSDVKRNMQFKAGSTIFYLNIEGKAWPQNEGSRSLQETSGSVTLVFYRPLLYKQTKYTDYVASLGF